jgi:hypothetical protein
MTIMKKSTSLRLLAVALPLIAVVAILASHNSAANTNSAPIEQPAAVAPSTDTTAVTPTPTQVTAPASSPVQSNNYFSIPELGLRMSVSAAYKNDLVYKVTTLSNGSKMASFSTKSLEKLDGGKYCSAAEGPIGTITRGTAPTYGDANLVESDAQAANDPFIKKLGQNDYARFTGPQAMCATTENKVVNDKQTEDLRNLTNIFKTIEIIK